MAKYTAAITADDYAAQWYFFNASNRKAAEKYAHKIASVEFAEGENVIIVVDGITRGKAAAIIDEYESESSGVRHLSACLSVTTSEEKDLRRRFIAERNESFERMWAVRVPCKGIEFFGEKDFMPNAEWYR